MSSQQTLECTRIVSARVWSIWLLVLCAGLCGCGASKHTAVSGWNNHKIIVDGNNNDWELPYSYNSKEHKIQYDIANDSIALYLTLKTSNDVSAYKISKAGLYVYIDTADGRSEQMLLMCFAGDEQAEKREVPPGNSMLPIRDDTPRVALRRPAANADALMVSKIFVSGFATCNGAYAGQLKCKCRLQVAAKINDFGEMVWELAIPYDMMGMSGIAAAKEISICIAMNALQEGDRPLTAMTAMPRMRKPAMEAGGRGMGKPGGGGELPPDAGREDPGGGDDQADYQARIDDLDRLTKVIHIWKRIKLSSGHSGAR